MAVGTSFHSQDAVKVDAPLALLGFPFFRSSRPFAVSRSRPGCRSRPNAISRISLSCESIVRPRSPRDLSFPRLSLLPSPALGESCHCLSIRSGSTSAEFIIKARTAARDNTLQHQSCRSSNQLRPCPILWRNGINQPPEGNLSKALMSEAKSHERFNDLIEVLTFGRFQP